MANILQILGAAGKGLEGYGIDRQRRVTNALAQSRESRDAENDRVRNLLMGAQTTKLMAPPEPKAPELTTALEQGPDGKPIHVRAVDKPGVRVPGPAVPAVPTERFTFQQGADAEGNPVIFKASTSTGKLENTGAAGRMNTAKPPTEGQEKSALFYDLMKNAEPGILKAQSSGKIRPEAVTAYLNSMDVPLLGRLAKPLINSQLNAEEQQLLRDAKDFTAGVLRKETGAAYSATEIMDTMERYFPGMFGDKPELTEAKAAARARYMEAMKDQASPASSYYEMRKGGKPSSDGTVDHSKMSDEEFAKAYRAGQFRTP